MTRHEISIVLLAIWCVFWSASTAQTTGFQNWEQCPLSQDIEDRR